MYGEPTLSYRLSELLLAVKVYYHICNGSEFSQVKVSTNSHFLFLLIVILLFISGILNVCSLQVYRIVIIIAD